MMASDPLMLGPVLRSVLAESEHHLDRYSRLTSVRARAEFWRRQGLLVSEAAKKDNRNPGLVEQTFPISGVGRFVELYHTLLPEVVDSEDMEWTPNQLLALTMFWIREKHCFIAALNCQKYKDQYSEDDMASQLISEITRLMEAYERLILSLGEEVDQ